MSEYSIWQKEQKLSEDPVSDVPPEIILPLLDDRAIRTSSFDQLGRLLVASVELV